jgi:hypothetical protein
MSDFSQAKIVSPATAAASTRHLPKTWASLAGSRWWQQVADAPRSVLMLDWRDRIFQQMNDTGSAQKLVA